MDDSDGDSRLVRVAVIGDRIPGLAPQDSIQTSLGRPVALSGGLVEVAWYPTPILADDASELLADADAVWCTPGSPYRSLAGALAGIGYAREHDRPLLGPCAGYQRGVIEFARNVLGIADAGHAEYGDLDTGPMFIDELLCSLVGTTMTVR